MATESKPPGSEEPILNVVGERVALGPLREDLLPLYGRWINDFSTISMLGLPPALVTAEKKRDWHEGRSRAENDLMFTIYERENLRPIGNTDCTASTTATGAHPLALCIDWRAS